MPLISETDAWRQLEKLRSKTEQVTLGELFTREPERANYLTRDLGNLYLDCTRQRVDRDIWNGLLDLARAADAYGFVRRMMDGDVVNVSEQRQAAHMAYRGTPISDKKISGAIKQADGDLEALVASVHTGEFKSASGKPFSAAVVIGIGGSALGPALAIDALSDTCEQKMDVRVCSNIDGIDLARAFKGLNVPETMVVVISKSFTTADTTVNAELARTLLQKELSENWAQNFIAVTANADAAAEFGVHDDCVLPMWDWVGGRYSVWSNVGLPIALAFGYDALKDMRKGAADIDTHVMASPMSCIPMMMALVTVWNTSFLGCQTEACVPYDTRLALLIAYLKQLEMESNGKRVTQEGVAVDYDTQPVIFGGVGVNVQHAFFQQLHQGTMVIPVDFLLAANMPGDVNANDLLASSSIAQADALAFGRENVSEPHRHYPGDRPSNILVYRELNAKTLGELLAIYEHKTAITGAIWGVNSFDQWGVELGKAIGGDVQKMMKGDLPATETAGPLLGVLRRMRPSGQ